MVKLEDRRVVLYLSDEGRRVMRQAGIDVLDAGGFSFDVQEAVEHGLWVRMDFEDGQHVILIRWNYILAIDVGGGEIRTEGRVNRVN
jgi:hypothetical protein